MRNIDSSEWLRNPELEVVETKQGEALGARFTLFADQITTAGAEAEQSNATGNNVVARRGTSQ
jgi:hypothetical protein